MDYLTELGFPTAFYNIFEDMQEAVEEIERIGNMRGTFDYAIDGAVVKVDDFATRELLGSTANIRNGRRHINIRPKKRRQIA